MPIWSILEFVYRRIESSTLYAFLPISFAACCVFDVGYPDYRIAVDASSLRSHRSIHRHSVIGSILKTEQWRFLQLELLMDICSLSALR
jgi:hypothetical protein